MLQCRNAAILVEQKNLKKLRKMLVLHLYFLYLCIVDKGDRIYALGSEKIFLVHEDKIPKANGKKEVPVGREN